MLLSQFAQNLAGSSGAEIPVVLLLPIFFEGDGGGRDEGPGFAMCWLAVGSVMMGCGIAEETACGCSE